MAEKNRDLLSGNNIGGTVIVGMEELLPHIERIVRKVMAEGQLSTPAKPDPDDCITIKQVAKEFGVSANTVRNRIDEGLLEPKGIGGIIKLRRGDCHELFFGDRTKIYQTKRRKSAGSKG